jgi:hypothetical protein
VPVVLEPFDHFFLEVESFLEVLCRTGRVPGTNHLENFPDISDNKSAHPPPSIVQQISLMAMGEKDLLIRRHMMKDQAFVDFDSIKQGFRNCLRTGFSLSFFIVMVKIFFNVSGVLPLSVMVPPYEIKPMGSVKLAHLPKNMAMCLSDVFKGPIFPKFVPVPDFDVSEAMIEVEIQGMEEDILILGKVVGPTVVSTMTITEENIL